MGAATYPGCSTTGSSEAAVLGGLALKWQWRERHTAGVDRPNVVCRPLPSVLEKVARYFDVELCEIPLARNAAGRTPDPTAQYFDEDTIGLVPTLGTTFTGAYGSVQDIAGRLLARDKISPEKKPVP